MHLSLKWLKFIGLWKEYNCKLTNASPRYAKLNIMSELTLGVMKRILKKCSNSYISLLEYLKTPLTGMIFTLPIT